MSILIFEKIGDINSTYPYLCVYVKKMDNPFMEIGINDKKELVFMLYQSSKNTALTAENWKEISDKANEFLPKALADYDFD